MGAVVPSTSASLVHPCLSRSITEVFVQHAPSREWVALPQLGHHGELLLLELCGMQCAAGCRVAARFRDGLLLNATTADGKDLIVTPAPTVPPPHVPGHRIELLLHPPLAPPFAASAQRAIDDLLRQLTDNHKDEHFVMRRERIKLAEVSTTGAFVMLDIAPEDIYAYLSGPDVPRILLRLAMRADVFNLTGRTLDPRYGLWRQATPTKDAAIHKALPAKRLWPHHPEEHDAKASAAQRRSTPPSAAAHRPAPQRTAQRRSAPPSAVCMLRGEWRARMCCQTTLPAQPRSAGVGVASQSFYNFTLTRPLTRPLAALASCRVAPATPPTPPSPRPPASPRSISAVCTSLCGGNGALGCFWRPGSAAAACLARICRTDRVCWGSAR